MKHHIVISSKIIYPLLHMLNLFKDLGNLIALLWLAKIFINSSISKLQDLGATMVLFKYDYHVPWISHRDSNLSRYGGTIYSIDFANLRSRLEFGYFFFLYLQHYLCRIIPFFMGHSWCPRPARSYYVWPADHAVAVS